MEETEPKLMDSVSKAVLETIGDAGFLVTVGASERLPVVTAVNTNTGERFVVRGGDLYHATVELAEQVGIELEDG